MQRCPKILLISGLSIVTLGILFGLVLFPQLLQRKIRQQIRLEEDGDLYSRWVNIKIPIFMKIYLFEVQNPEEFSEGAKPVLKEIGPFVYQQKRQKIVTHINTENDTLQFRPKITYFFREDMSNGLSDSDVINFFNVPLASVVAKALKLGSFTRSMIRSIVDEHKEDLFMKKTVKEFLFDGYHEAMIEELSELSGEEIMPNNTFGIYYGKNATGLDLFEIYTGIQDTSKFGETVSWNNAQDINMWGNEYCNMINGSDGSIFPPFLTKDRVLRVFSPEMCRSVYMTYVEEVEIKGVPAYKFATPKAVMGDPRVYAENICYCKEADNDDPDLSDCTKDGLFMLGPCRKGAPIAASYPHFYSGDQEYVDMSVGLNPQQEKHESFLMLEPNTAALLQASKRFQINVEVKPTKHFPKFKKVPSVVLPILWVDESVALTDENADMLRGKLLTPLKVGSLGMFGLMGFGAVLILVGIVVGVLVRGRDEKE